LHQSHVVGQAIDGGIVQAVKTGEDGGVIR